MRQGAPTLRALDGLSLATALVCSRFLQGYPGMIADAALPYSHSRPNLKLQRVVDVGSRGLSAPPPL